MFGGFEQAKDEKARKRWFASAGPAFAGAASVDARRAVSTPSTCCSGRLLRGCRCSYFSPSSGEQLERSMSSTVSKSIALDTWRALGSRNGGEVVGAY